jgi:predicted dehydrogenase
MQSASDTPTVRHFNPDKDIGADYRAGWIEAPAATRGTNPYRVGWENFLRHVVTGAPLVSDLSAGIRDVQLAEACARSVAQGQWAALDPVA